jgi:hypothetical protein
LVDNVVGTLVEGAGTVVEVVGGGGGGGGGGTDELDEVTGADVDVDVDGLVLGNVTGSEADVVGGGGGGEDELGELTVTDVVVVGGGGVGGGGGGVLDVATGTEIDVTGIVLGVVTEIVVDVAGDVDVGPVPVGVNYTVTILTRCITRHIIAVPDSGNGRT